MARREAWFVQVATSVAAMLEWYDFSIFGFMATEVGRNFFDEDDGDALIKTLGLFGGAFIARPIGGVIFGHLGDMGCGGREEPLIRRRLRALEGSLLLMAVPAVAIAVLPNRSVIGAAAPVAMLLVRLMQGLSVGGQLVGALLSAAEEAPPGRELGVVAYVMAACNSGTLLGATVSFACHAAFSDEELVEWAWRVPFAIGALLSIAAFAMIRAVRQFSGRREDPAAARVQPGDVHIELPSTASRTDSTAPAHQPTNLPGEQAVRDNDATGGGPSVKASPLRSVLASSIGRRKLFGCVCAWGVHTSTFYTTVLFMPLFEVTFLFEKKGTSAAAFALSAVSQLLACIFVSLVGRFADFAVRPELEKARAASPDAAASTSVLSPPCHQQMGLSADTQEKLRVGYWAPPPTCLLQHWLGVRVRAAAISLAIASPLALLIAQFGALPGNPPVVAWATTIAAVTILLIHLVIIDALVGAWLLSIFAPEVRFSAVALAVNVGTMLFAAPAPAVELALASTSHQMRWSAGLFVSAAAVFAVVGTRIAEDPRDDRRRLAEPQSISSSAED